MPDLYPKATKTPERWYSDDFDSATFTPDKCVWHTTETYAIPWYQADGINGATAPNYTVAPDLKAKRLLWIPHFYDNESSRALRNLIGGVETNTDRALQVELVGTCSPSVRDTWKTQDRSFIFWPDAPDWALRELADFVDYCHETHGIPLIAATFDAYPRSITSVRMSMTTWRNAVGHVGHQHVPENTHGDPGDLDFPRILQLVKEASGPTHVELAWKHLEAAESALEKALLELGNAHPRRARVKAIAVELAETIAQLKAEASRLPER